VGPSLGMLQLPWECSVYFFSRGSMVQAYWEAVAFVICRVPFARICWIEPSVLGGIVSTGLTLLAHFHFGELVDADALARRRMPMASGGLRSR